MAGFVTRVANGAYAESLTLAPLSRPASARNPWGDVEAVSIFTQCYTNPSLLTQNCRRSIAVLLSGGGQGCPWTELTSEGTAMNVHLRNVVANCVASGYVVPVGWRIGLMRAVGIEIGDGTEIKSRCTIAGPGKVSFGADGYVNFACIFDATGDITVGDRVNIAPGVAIGTCTHDIGPARQRAGRRFPDAVRIGDGCWIGMNVAILPGVTIGSGCVIAAGAAVTEDCEPNGLYGGVPARRIRDLDREPAVV